MACQKCGNQLNPGDKFCMKCGTPVESAVPETIINQQPQAAPAPVFGADVTPAPVMVSEPVVTPPAAPFVGTGNVVPPAAQTNMTPSPKKSKKLLFIGLAVGAAVLIIALVAFLMYYFSGPVAFERNSEELSGNGYSLRMPKGWKTTVEFGMITVAESTSESEGIIKQGSIDYSGAKSDVDTVIDGLSASNGKVDSKKESTNSVGKNYVAEGNVDIGGKNVSFSSYLMYDTKESKSSWLLLVSSDKKVLTSVTNDAQYILSSVKVDKIAERGLFSFPEYNSVQGVFGDVNLSK
ncbi:MAG: zinc-ribbon domain-containing protein [Candidatus Saccharibacteria bacterium]